jgi:apolipoprotein N-acyltransferase
MSCWSKNFPKLRRTTKSRLEFARRVNRLLSFTDRYALPLALVAGAATVFSFAPFGWWPLQLATLAFVFWLVARQASVKRSALIGWAYGFGWTTCGVYWLYISMHTYGGMPAWLAALAVGVMGLVLGSFAALALGLGAWIVQRLSSANSPGKRGISQAITLLLVFPSVWMLAEWARGWVLTGLPWVVAGYAHSAGPLAGFAPVIGVYGIGGLAALAGGSLALASTRRSALLITVVILAAGAGLKTISWTTPHGQAISVRLLQGNVPQEMKFEEKTVIATLRLYQDMIAAAPADLIATPETAMPLLSNQLPTDYLPQLQTFARASNSHIALGIPISDGPRQYANSVLGFSARDSTGLYRYDKQHLVPFGEFVPFGARWFVRMMHIPLGDFTSGSSLQAPFPVRDQFVLPNICYEDLFGEEIAAQLAAHYSSGPQQATILLNHSNIAWFGDSIALPQHLQISQMRALETGRPMLRATNTGATAVIGPDGVVQAQLPPFTRGTLAARVQGYAGWTPYILLGNSLAVGLALLALALAWLLARRKPAKSLSE